MAKIGSLKFYIILAIVIVIFLPPFAKYQALRYKNNKLEERMEELRKESARLEIEKRKLETDIAYIEKRARENIGVVKKGEIVLKEVPVRK